MSIICISISASLSLYPQWTKSGGHHFPEQATGFLLRDSLAQRSEFSMSGCGGHSWGMEQCSGEAKRRGALKNLSGVTDGTLLSPAAAS